MQYQNHFRQHIQSVLRPVTHTPGPDGFSFKFLKHFWDVIKDDIFHMVTNFGDSSKFSRGCNSSYISLIPKVKDPLFLKDFRPINLLGCMYKVVAKLLARRLKKVMHKVVGKEQSAYVYGRNVLDGPLMVNEFESLCFIVLHMF